MSKDKSEILTVKTQLKVKFPHAVITKIKTLPPVIPKMFRTAVWRNTRDNCFWHYVCKTINLCSRKLAVTVFTEKIFKKCLSIQSMISSCSKHPFWKVLYFK